LGFRVRTLTRFGSFTEAVGGVVFGPPPDSIRFSFSDHNRGSVFQAIPRRRTQMKDRRANKA